MRGVNKFKAETKDEVETRKRKFLEFVEKRKEKRILVVSHANFIRSLIGRKKLDHGEMAVMEFVK